jgi:hypothetical protein
MLLKEKKDGGIDNVGVKIIRILGKKKIKKVEFSTVDEILNDILKTIPLEFLEGIKEMTADEFRISQHSNLGMTIRNKYFYRNKAREQLIESLGNKKEYIFLDGDVFSRIVLKKLYEKITTESKQQP